MLSLQRLLWSVGVSLLVVSVAAADPQNENKKPDKKRPEGGQGAGPFSPEVLEKLNLSDEQKEKLQKLRQELHEKRKAAENKSKEEKARLKEAMEKARQDNDSETVQRLQKEMDKLQEGMKKSHGDMENLLSGVLNDEQKKKLEEMKKSRKPGEQPGGKGPGHRDLRGGMLMHPQMQERLNLSDEQKQKIKQLQQELESKLQGVLTDEQKKKLEDMKKDGPPRPGQKPGEK